MQRMKREATTVSSYSGTRVENHTLFHLAAPAEGRGQAIDDGIAGGTLSLILEGDNRWTTLTDKF